MEKITKTIDRIARELACDDVIGGECVTLTSAIDRMETEIGRISTDDERRSLVAGYGRHLREIERRHKAIASGKRERRVAVIL